MVGLRRVEDNNGVCLFRLVSLGEGNEDHLAYHFHIENDQYSSSEIKTGMKSEKSGGMLCISFFGRFLHSKFHSKFQRKAFNYLINLHFKIDKRA